jgi:hypothetical protein
LPLEGTFTDRKISAKVGIEVADSWLEGISTGQWNSFPLSKSRVSPEMFAGQCRHLLLVVVELLST